MICRVRFAQDVRDLCAHGKIPDLDVRWELHPEIAEEELRKIFHLAEYAPSADSLCVALAEWYGTPPDILAELAKMSSVAVSQAVAFHPKCPAKELELLAHCDDPLTRQHAEWTTGRKLLTETNLPARTLWDLYNKNRGHESHNVALRYEMVKHPNIPLQLLHALAQDISPQVRGPAEMRLRLAHR